MTSTSPLKAAREPGKGKLRLGAALIGLALIGGLIFFTVVGARLIGSLDGVASLRVVEGETNEIELDEGGKFTFWFDPIVGEVSSSDVDVRSVDGEDRLAVEASLLAGVTLAVNDNDRVAWVDVDAPNPGRYLVDLGPDVVGSVIVAPAMPFGLLVALVIGGLIAGALFLSGFVLLLVGWSDRRRHRRMEATVTGWSAQQQPGGQHQPGFDAESGTPAYPAPSVSSETSSDGRPPPPPGIAGKSAPGAAGDWSTPTGPPGSVPQPGDAPQPGGPPRDDIAPPPIASPPATPVPRPTPQPSGDGTGWSQPSRAPRLPPGFDGGTGSE